VDPAVCQSFHEKKPVSYIVPESEPFFFPGGTTGCLLLHGFSSTPGEMRPFGKYLAEKGFAVLGVRLAGHATHPNDLKRTRWIDWLFHQQRNMVFEVVKKFLDDIGK
jgi:esterase/lipase